MTPLASSLLRAAQLLEARLAVLEDRVRHGDEAAWAPYLEAVQGAAALEARLTPGSRGELLTTRAMAERLGITPKTLLKRKAKGQIRPAMQAGKLIRWRGSEAVR